MVETSSLGYSAADILP